MFSRARRTDAVGIDAWGSEELQPWHPVAGLVLVARSTTPGPSWPSSAVSVSYGRGAAPPGTVKSSDNPAVAATPTVALVPFEPVVS
jgi:hypothetical protein